MTRGISVAVAAAAVIGVMVVGAGALYFTGALQGVPGTSLSSTNSDTNSSSVSFSQIATSIVETSSTTTRSNTSSAITTANASSYSSSPSPLRILSVESLTLTEGSVTTVAFRVTFQNEANYSIQVAGGCASCLNSTVPSDSQVIRTTSDGPRCLCATMLLNVNPGQDFTAASPGCWSGYHYELVQAGSVSVQLTISWSASGGGGAVGKTTIDASFTFG